VTALLLVEVIDTAEVMADAILAWIVAAAFVATVVVYTLVLTGAWAWRAARRRSTGSLAASQPADAPIPPRTAERPTAPSWAHANDKQQEAA
jgi:ABC-type transport system involved in Fe-S cluster assembly fused permease/ATPase subunit